MMPFSSIGSIKNQINVDNLRPKFLRVDIVDILYTYKNSVTSDIRIRKKQLYDFVTTFSLCVVYY